MINPYVNRIDKIAEETANAEVVAQQKNHLRLVETGEIEPELKASIIDNFFSEMRAPIERLSFGIKSIDNLFGEFINGELQTGFRRKDIIILFGMSGGGKTTFAMTMFANMFKAGRKVSFYSFDMREEKTLDFFRYAFSGFKATMEDLVADFAAIKRKPTIVCRKGKTSIFDIDEHLTRVPAEAIFIDYIDQLEPSGKFTVDKNKNEALMLQLQTLADKHNCSIILLSQGSEDKSYKYGKPTLTNLYGGKEVRSAADHILGVYRPAKHNEELEEKFHNVSEVLGLKLRSHSKRDKALMKLDDGKMVDLAWYEIADYKATTEKKKAVK